MSPFLHSRLAIVDLETTGMAATSDRITEIGIVLVEEGTVIEEWVSLINPEVPIPSEIQAMTGITDAMVRDAPSFAEIASAVLTRLNGCLLVAHNARFDYGFLKNAFKRAGLQWRAEVLCTVRLSRRLWPGASGHGLDALIHRHALEGGGRHRALGDARIVADFLRTVVASHSVEEIQAAVRALLKMPSLPAQLDPGVLDRLPEGPGVYVFYGVSDLPIYIGKSVNLRDRVRAHFSSDHRHSNDVRLSMEIRRIEFEECAGEIGALLRESQLVKACQPLHNIRLRRNAEMAFVRLVDLETRAEVVRFEDVELAHSGGLYGPFRTRAAAKAALVAEATEHALCWKALGAQTTDGPCFARQLARCKGWCVGAESLVEHNVRLREALRAHLFTPWPFPGAIAIVEEHAEEGWRQWHVFDAWRWLGSSREESGILSIAQRAHTGDFDADIFRLLRRFVEREPSRVVALPTAAYPTGPN